MRKFEHDPLNVRVYTFNNGLQLIASNQSKEPRIYTMVAVKTGSANDPADHTGLAHYLEHMLFKGTDKYGTSNWEEEKKHLATIDLLYNEYNKTKNDSLRPIVYSKIDSVSQLAATFSIANEYDKMCQAMGASGTNAFTDKDNTCYINEIPSNTMHQWIELESERFRNPILRLFHTELEAVYEEKNISLDRDNSRVWEAMNSKLYPNHPYGTQTTIGTIEHLKNPSLQAIRDYYNQYYVPNNMAIIMAGDFDPELAADAIAEHFKYMKPKNIEKKSILSGMPYGRPQKIDVYGKNAESVLIGYKVERTNPKNESILKVVDLLLSNSSAGLIDINLNLSQKVQAAYSFTSINNDYCALLLGGQPKKGQALEEVDSLLVQQINAIKEGKFDEQSLKAIILNTDINQISGFESNSSRAYFLMDAFISEKGYRNHYNQLAEMAKLTKEEIIEFANEYLSEGRVEVYKHQGELEDVVKIKKPTIHPVELNRDKQSSFVKEWLEEESDQIEPQVADFTKLKQVQVKDNLELWYVKNEVNRLFKISYLFDQGTYHNQVLPFTMDYLELCGSETINASALQTKLYTIGCSFYTSINSKNMTININGPQESFKEAVMLIEDLLTNPKISQEVLDGIVANELKARENAKLNPKAIAGRLLSYSMYGSVNPSNDILSSKGLNNLKAEDMVKLIKQLRSNSHHIEYYGPGELNEVKQIAGDLHQVATFKRNPLPRTYELRKIQKPEVLFTNYEQVQASIYWYNTSHKFDKDKATVASAFNTYFGGDMSSVVFQSIRESKALAYSTSASQRNALEKGKYNYNLAFIGTQADKFNEAVNGMNELITKLPIDNETFKLAKQSIENDVRTSRVMPENLAWLKRYYTRMGLDDPLTMQVLEEIPTIDMKDVVKFHKKYWSKSSFSLSVVGDKNKIDKASLKKYGDLKTLSLTEIFGY